jgi:hypothetical protein
MESNLMPFISYFVFVFLKKLFIFLKKINIFFYVFRYFDELILKIIFKK